MSKISGAYFHEGLFLRSLLSEFYDLINLYGFCRFPTIKIPLFVNSYLLEFFCILCART